jgi:hypothetical protein
MQNIKYSSFIGVCLFWVLATSSCKKNSATQLPFGSTPSAAVLSTVIKEASGIADSKVNAGMLWVQEDGGNNTQLYLINRAAQLNKKIFLKNSINRDWEDIAISTGPVAGKNYIYLAEIGDNNAAYSTAFFYRFEEPNQTKDTITAIDKIEFVYSDGARDAEAFLVDAATKDIFIITKRDTKSLVYKLAYPQSTSTINTAILVTTLAYNGVVSAAINISGTEMIIKTYTNLYYYKKAVNIAIDKALQTNYTLLSYQQEPQGEAISFANDNTGFFTLSEQFGSIPQQLYFYNRQ